MDAFLFVALSTLFTIVNPLGALGPFLGMTIGESTEKRRQHAKRASIVAASVLATCALAGAFIFRFYGITIPALKIAGGILLFFIAFDMINARPSRTKQTAEETSEGVQKDDIGVFPLGIPLLAGPGSIVSVFMLADQAKTIPQEIGLYGAIAIISFIAYLTLREAHRLVGLLGQIGLNVFSRLMGVVLAAIAVQFVLDGIRAALPGLAGVVS
jgi:multiple antibiotic resistance protein